MDMLRPAQIADAALADWRKLAQGIHARYLVPDFSAGVRFLAAVAEAGDAVGHHPVAHLGDGHVDLELVTDDAVYRDEDDGSELVLEWVTQQDVDLARRITGIAAQQGLHADPASVTEVELGLDAADSARIAPFWAALLTGDPGAQGHGSPSDEVRDPTGRVPNLWFGAGEKGWHVEVYVAPEALEQRLAAVLAAGGTVVDDSASPSLTVVADPDGTTGVLCVAGP